MTTMSWPIFNGTGAPVEGVVIPDPPQWRTFQPRTEAQEVPPTPEIPGLAPVGLSRANEAETHKPEVLEMVSAAIALRRPLLVTGPPGCGKSILATLIAVELRLGPLLRWPITSSSRLDKALYDYDAIGRVHELNSQQNRGDDPLADPHRGIGRFIRLGPLGTALLPWTKPRVLLIDEIDKSDIDLPNELLDVFELGEFRVPELERLAADHPDSTPEPVTEAPIPVMTADRGRLAGIVGGVVRCAQFPVVVMTSNGERSFPPAFLRRCLQLKLTQPTGRQLRAIVQKRIAQDQDSESSDLLSKFAKQVGQNKNVATDQLLNAIFLVTSRGLGPDNQERMKVYEAIVQDLDQVSS
jgi:MoxR-like ATPase